MGLLRTMTEAITLSGDNYELTALIDPTNERIKITSVAGEDLVEPVDQLIDMARDQGFGKLVSFAPEEQWQNLLANGFVPEGLLPGYFADGGNAHCLSYFLSAERQTSRRFVEKQALLQRVLQVPLEPDTAVDRPSPVPLGPADAPELARLYASVFVTYPTPVDDPAFLRRQMQAGEGFYFGIRSNRRLVSAAAAEVDRENGNAEMTNCATEPGHRGQGLMAAIFAALEKEMERQGVPMLFSMARASSFGMNLVLRRAGYRFTGRMVNNAHISGEWEDMNLWAKQAPLTALDVSVSPRNLGR